MKLKDLLVETRLFNHALPGYVLLQSLDKVETMLTSGKTDGINNSLFNIDHEIGETKLTPALKTIGVYDFLLGLNKRVRAANNPPPALLKKAEADKKVIIDELGENIDKIQKELQDAIKASKTPEQLEQDKKDEEAKNKRLSTSSWDNR